MESEIETLERFKGKEQEESLDAAELYGLILTGNFKDGEKTKTVWFLGQELMNLRALIKS